MLMLCSISLALTTFQTSKARIRSYLRWKLKTCKPKIYLRQKINYQIYTGGSILTRLTSAFILIVITIESIPSWFTRTSITTILENYFMSVKIFNIENYLNHYFPYSDRDQPRLSFCKTDFWQEKVFV